MDIVSQLQDQVNKIAYLACNTAGPLQRDAPSSRLSQHYPEPPPAPPSAEGLPTSDPKAMAAAIVQAAKEFDALIAALPITEGGEESQLKLIAKLQIFDAQKKGKKHGKKRKKGTDFPGYLGRQSTFDKAKKHKKRVRFAEVPSFSSSFSSFDSSSDWSKEDRKGKKRSKKQRFKKDKKKAKKSKSHRVDDSSTEDTSLDSSDSEDGKFYANKKNFYKANQYDFLEDKSKKVREFKEENEEVGQELEKELEAADAELMHVRELFHTAADNCLRLKPPQMDGYREEGSSSQDRQSIPIVHEVGEGSSQTEEGFPHAAFSITGTASPGTVFRDMQGMVPNPMHANIGMQPRFWGTQGQFGVSEGN
ncbi:hypothetical protein L7F22_011673 [Adiantum nelumboides]|nr:hypothetical protein [Adiantum nelumboides]